MKQEWVSIPGEGFAFGDGGESAKAGCQAAQARSLLRGIPGAASPFQESKACSQGLIAHLSPKWSDSLLNHLPRQPSECRADCCLAEREGWGGSRLGAKPSCGEAMPAAPRPGWLAGVVSAAAS